MYNKIKSICIIAFLSLSFGNCRNLSNADGTNGVLTPVNQNSDVDGSKTIFYVDQIGTDSALITWEQKQKSETFSASIKKYEDVSFSSLGNQFFDDQSYEITDIEASTNYVFRIEYTLEDNINTVITDLYFRTLQIDPDGDDGDGNGNNGGDGSNLIQLLPPSNFSVSNFNNYGLNGLEVIEGVHVDPDFDDYYVVHVLTWDEVEDPSDGYLIRLKKGANGSYIYIPTVVYWKTSRNIPVMYCFPGTNVHYQIKTLGIPDTSLDSDWSDTWVISCPVP